MVAFRKPESLSEYLVRARFTSGSKEEVKGTDKCNSNRCQICYFLCLGRIFRNNKTGREYSINYNLDCNSYNVVYLITFKRCNIQYMHVGSTTTTFRTRFNNHKSRVNAHANLTLERNKRDDLLYQQYHG